jgi:hypothetical protein
MYIYTAKNVDQFIFHTKKCVLFLNTDDYFDFTCFDFIFRLYLVKYVIQCNVLIGQNVDNFIRYTKEKCVLFLNADDILALHFSITFS